MLLFVVFVSGNNCGDLAAGVARLRTIYLHIGIVWNKGNRSVSVFDAGMLDKFPKYRCRQRRRRATRARAPPYWYKINHNPIKENTKLLITQNGKEVRVEWVALRNIHEDEELTWCYSQSDKERALKMFGPAEV